MSSFEKAFPIRKNYLENLIILQIRFYVSGCIHFDQLSHAEKLAKLIGSMQSMRIEFSGIKVPYLPQPFFTLYLRLTFYYNKHRETHLFVKHPCISDSPKSIRKPIQRKITGKSIRNHDPVGNSGDPLQQGLRNRGNPWSGGKLLSSGKKLRVLKYEIF